MVAIPAAPSRAELTMAKTNNQKTVPGTRDLYRFIYALSGACERDCNVLRDGQLVDTLESQAKQIIRARRQNRSSSMASSSCSFSSGSSSSHRLSSSPLLHAMLAPSSTATTKKATKIFKRRKLPADHYNGKSTSCDKSPLGSAAAPTPSSLSYLSKLDGADTASLYMARGDGSSSLIPSVKIGKLERPYTPVVAHSVATDGAMHMEHLSLDKTATAAPFSSLSSSSSLRAPRKSVDLGASISSTISSSSMRHYDLSDAEDALTPTASARYASATSTYDHEDYLLSRAPTPTSCSALNTMDGGSLSVLLDAELDANSLLSSHRKDSCHSEASTSSSYDRVTPKKLRFEMDALSLYEKEQDLPMDALHLSSSASSHKSVESSLIETLQSQVDLLLTENVKALAQNARLTELSQMSSCEAEDHAMEKRLAVQQVQQQLARIDEIQHKLHETEQRADAQEDIRREAEVVFQAELDAKAELVTVLHTQVQAKDEEIARLSKRVEDISGLFGSKIREQEDRGLVLTGSMIRRSSAPSPLKQSSSSSLPDEMSTALVCVGATSPMAEAESEEYEMVEAMRESNLFMDMELQKMRSTLLEKDREICNLYMHLSTKKKLIEEITKKFVQHMEESAAATKATNTVAAPTAATTVADIEPKFATEGVRFDLDMFLFKNVVDKQRRMEELLAALGVMDREVEGLEVRVADQERENRQLRDNQDFLTRSLQTVNAQVCRIQAENERLDASNTEKQARITTLVESLEEKERRILHLDEQVDLRQTQIDHLMSSSGSDKASSSRRSLKSSLFKGRASLGSSGVLPQGTKGSAGGGSRASFMSFSSVRDAEEVDAQRRSSLSSSAVGLPQRTSFENVTMTRKTSMGVVSSVGMRSSTDWTDMIGRSSVASSQPPTVFERETRRTSIVSESEFALPARTSLFSQVFNDISSPMEDCDDEDEDSDDAASFFSMDGTSVGDKQQSELRSTRASYCASDINDDEELYNELFNSKA